MGSSFFMQKKTPPQLRRSKKYDYFLRPFSASSWLIL